MKELNIKCENTEDDYFLLKFIIEGETVESFIIDQKHTINLHYTQVKAGLEKIQDSLLSCVASDPKEREVIEGQPEMFEALMWMRVSAAISKNYAKQNPYQ